MQLPRARFPLIGCVSYDTARMLQPSLKIQDERWEGSCRTNQRNKSIRGSELWKKSPWIELFFSLFRFSEKEANGCSITLQRDLFKILKQGFTGDSVVKNLPASVGNMGFNPWSWKIPHTVEQLSPWVTTADPVLCSLKTATTEPLCWSHGSSSTLKPTLHCKKSHRNGKPVRHNRRVACTCGN